MSIEALSALITAITSIVAIVLTGFAFWFQVRQARATLSVTIIRDYEKDFFKTVEMRRLRYQVAAYLINRDPQSKDPPPQPCWEILDFFDQIGIYVNRGHIDPELAWTTFYHWFGVYWHCLAKDVAIFQRDNGGVPYLGQCQNLYAKLTRWGETHRRLGSPDDRYSLERIKIFFRDEMEACRNDFAQTQRMNSQ